MQQAPVSFVIKRIVLFFQIQYNKEQASKKSGVGVPEEPQRRKDCVTKEGKPMKKTNPASDDYIRRRKLLSGISVAVVVLLVVCITVFICNWLNSFSQEEFQDYIQSFGVLGWLVLLGMQFLQVFVALIPGELLETAAGFAVGPVAGTLLCYAGIAAASSLVFLLTRKYGVRLVEVFISREKINELRFINTESKRNNLIFLIFFIPGTPKDLLTYFVGLTDIKLHVFLAISLAARLPSILSSTFGGHLLGEGQYGGAVWLYGITGAVSLVGLLVYNKMIRRKKVAEQEKDS